MFDKIIISSDESYFLQYLPLVSKAWMKFFNKKVTLAFVTNRDYYKDDLIKKLQQYADVVQYPIIEDIPIANQAKMVRHILASRMESSVCMIEDIDTIPLQTSFINRILSQRKGGELLLVGKEIYQGTEDADKIPISNMTGEGYLFDRIINPNNLDYEALINSWIDHNLVDNKEAINNSPNNFSDESLLRGLIVKYMEAHNDVTIHKHILNKINRSVDIKNDWIDRSWWHIDENKLNNGDYVICNFLRPFSENYSAIEPVVKYICGNDVKREDIILTW